MNDLKTGPYFIKNKQSKCIALYTVKINFLGQLKIRSVNNLTPLNSIQNCLDDV